MIKIMLCGASDLKSTILGFFQDVTGEIGLIPLNYLDGSIYYTNYGHSPWVKNSKMNVQTADIIVFVIQEKYGRITWDIEFEEAYNTGKNFIFFCNQEIYSLYRSSQKHNISFSDDDKDLTGIINGLKKLESQFQITIVPYAINSFRDILKIELLKLFNAALIELEKQNGKFKLMPVLMSSKFKESPQEYINERNETIVKSLLFDFFEKKEIRKKVMEYFFYSKSLSDDEIVELCLDSEQGVSRKAIENISELIGSNSDKNRIFEEVLQAISHSADVGMIRRAINSFINIDLYLSIKYYHYFFPTSDSSVPGRIVSRLYEHKNIIKQISSKDAFFKNKVIELLEMSNEFNKDKTLWREQLRELISEIEYT